MSSVAGASSSVRVRSASKSVPWRTAPPPAVEPSTLSEASVAVTASWSVSPSSRPETGVKVTVALCTMSVSWPVKVSFGVAVVVSAAATPVPEALTAKSGVASPGSRAPVVVARVRGTAMTSPAYRRRASPTVTVAGSEASPSRIRASVLVSATTVGSSSSMRAVSAPRVDDTV